MSAKTKRRTGGIQGTPQGLERPVGGAGPVGGASLDWALIELIISKAVKASRSEELKELATTVKELAEEVKAGFESHERALSELREVLKEQSEHVEKLSKQVASLSDQVAALREGVAALTREVGDLKATVAKLNVTVGSVGRRFGLDLERTVLNLYKDALAAMGLEEEKVEKLTLEDVDGRLYKKGARLELDVLRARPEGLLHRSEELS